MSPLRRSQTSNNNHSHQQQNSHNTSQHVTPSKKSPVKSSQNNQVLQSLVSTGISLKDQKQSQMMIASQNNSQSTHQINGTQSDVKEILKLQSQRSTQNQQNQAYNLRSHNTSANANDKVKKSGDEKGYSPRYPRKDDQRENVNPTSVLRGKSLIRTSSLTPIVKANKTLNLKNTHNHITTTRTPNSKKHNAAYQNYNDEDYESPSPEQIRCRFATERINLPRGKVVRCSPLSSANGSKRNSQSPVKLPRNMPPLQEPNFEHKVDYFKEYWRLYFQNETLVADIEQTAHSNYKALKKIYNLEDYYEHNLIPQLLTYPHKFVHRLRQQKLQKEQQQQKLIMQQKQQQELLMQMKNNSSKVDSAHGSSLNQQHQHFSSQQSNNNDLSHNNANDDQSSSQNGGSVNGSGSGHSNGGGLSHHHLPLSLAKDRANKRKKHLRRTAAEIEREFICPYAECGKFYGSEGSLNLHIKIKHNGGNKTERERLAKTLVQAYVNGNINRELDSLDLNLPPGALQKAVKKAGLVQQVSENEILRQITTQIHQISSHHPHPAVNVAQSVISGIPPINSLDVDSD